MQVCGCWRSHGHPISVWKGELIRGMSRMCSPADQQGPRTLTPLLQNPEEGFQLQLIGVAQGRFAVGPRPSRLLSWGCCCCSDSGSPSSRCMQPTGQGDGKLLDIDCRCRTRVRVRAATAA